MKKYLFLIFLLLTNFSLLSQTTIYSESCGNPSVTTLVNVYTGWQNNGIQVYTGNADVRNTVASTTYAGASGLGNVFITSTLNTNVTISNINTTNYSNLILSFGHLKTTNASNGSQLVIEVSSDGTTWTSLTYTVPTGGGTSNVWRLVTPTGTIPSVSNLRIRFRMATVVTGLQFRIDDIKLTGCPVATTPSVSYTSPACNSTTVSLPANTYIQTTSTGTNTSFGNVITSSGTYYARSVATSGTCPASWSTPVTMNVTIKTTPTITLNPRDTTVQEGQVVYFFASSPDSFYWESSSDSFTWTPIDSIKRDTLVMPGADLNWDTYYRITARNSPCSNVSSTVARLTVYPSTLPVELSFFKCFEYSDRVLLNWATYSEINNYKFEIERSSDAIEWDNIGVIFGAGYSSNYLFYQFEDNNPKTGLSYYRLKQVDFNGDYEYSNIVLSNFKSTKNNYKRFYNLMGIEVYELKPNTVYLEVSEKNVRMMIISK